MRQTKIAMIMSQVDMRQHVNVDNASNLLQLIEFDLHLGESHSFYFCYFFCRFAHQKNGVKNCFQQLMKL